MKQKFAVDWDGTCVEDAWPAMGDWLPGAIDALKHLSSLGSVTIWSCRTNPVYRDLTPRPIGESVAEVNAIREMLDKAGLRTVDIHDHKLGKPSADFYIDNKALRYTGRNRSWKVLLERINTRMEYTPV